MEFTQFIVENNMIVIAVLYAIGMILQTTKINNKYIPAILMVAGITFICAIDGLNATSVMQGILTAAAAVYTNQLIKQINK